MREISIAGRTVTISLAATTHGEDGDIQRYLVKVSGSDAATHLSILRMTSAVDARAMASAIETELLLDYPGSREDGVLRDPSVRAWRDKHRTAIEAALGRLRDEIAGMPPEPVSDLERTLLRAFEMDPDAPILTMREYPWFDFNQVDFVTSDTHFSHARISELADRPFSTVAEMDTALIRRWNDVVAPDSVVLHLGDLALGPIAESLPLTAHLHGRRFLVPGNHDRVSPATQSKRAIERFLPMYEAAGWEILPEVIEGTRDGYRIIASHYPYAGDSQPTDRHASHRPRGDDGIPLLHGHTHARDHGPNGHQFHVGVDAHDFAPIPFSVIDAWIRSLPGIETRLRTAVREAREVIADLDDTPPPNMDLMFFMQAFDELHMHLEELLAAVDEVEHATGDDGEGSR